MHKEELRLNMDIAIGRAPPLSDGQMQGRLRKEAHHLVAEFRDHNKQVRVRARAFAPERRPCCVLFQNVPVKPVY